MVNNKKENLSTSQQKCRPVLVSDLQIAANLSSQAKAKQVVCI
jgi:hypothetical protein